MWGSSAGVRQGKQGDKKQPTESKFNVVLLSSSLPSLSYGSTLSGDWLRQAEAHRVVLRLPEGHREQPVQAFRLPAGDLHRHGHRHFPRRPDRLHLCNGPRPQRRAVLHTAASAEEHVQDKQTGRQHRGSAGPGTRQVGPTTQLLPITLVYISSSNQNALIHMNLVPNYVIKQSKSQGLPANNAIGLMSTRDTRKLLFMLEWKLESYAKEV